MGCTSSVVSTTSVPITKVFAGRSYQLLPFEPVADNPIKYVIAVDGGYTEVAVQTEFPSATVCFFQFGALIFSVADLERLEEQPFIDPDDMAKLKQIQRLKFTLPIRNVTLKNETTLTHSVRRALYGFFRQPMDDTSLMDTLRWLIFQEYQGGVAQYMLARCPHCETSNVALERGKMSKNHTWECRFCKVAKTTSPDGAGVAC